MIVDKEPMLMMLEQFFSIVERSAIINRTIFIAHVAGSALVHAHQKLSVCCPVLLYCAVLYCVYCGLG